MAQQNDWRDDDHPDESDSFNAGASRLDVQPDGNEYEFERGKASSSDTSGHPSAYDQTYQSGADFGQSSDHNGVNSRSAQDSADRRPFPGATWTSGNQPAPRVSWGWIVVLVAVVLLFVLLFFAVASCSTSFDALLGTTSSNGDIAAETIGVSSVGVIEMNGDVDYDGSLCSPEGFKEQLDIAANNSAIKALVIRVNSGGGTAAAGEEMTAYLKEFKESTGKPVVVSSASINASAAYMISSQADYIYTLEATSIGGIGTALQFTDLSGLYELLGIDINTITSSDGKDTTYGTRPLTDDEITYYQAMVDQINDDFIQKVAEGRNMSVDDVRALATGLTFTGRDAVDNGLADDIGTLEDALDKACVMAGLSSCNVIYLYPDTSDIYDLISLLGTLQSSDTEETFGGSTDSDRLSR